MPRETPQQKLRGLLDRLSINDARRRELDAVIEGLGDEQAGQAMEAIEAAEAETPGLVASIIEEINAQGDLPDD